jgi:predicted outer membrane repeat protein
MRGPIIIVICLLATIPCSARIITVDDDGPADYSNVQAAIDAAEEGDEIIVSIGIYYENISFRGNNFILRSTEPLNPIVVAATIIDGHLGGSVVTFTGTESSTCVLSGFTITNGRGTGVGYNYGGGIYGNGTLATIQNNIISGNRTASPYYPCSGFGGGLYDCDGTIQCNIISANFTSGNEGQAWGGGLYGCDGIIRNNIISGNWAFSGWGCYGGGIASCNGTIQNNTIFGNLAGDYGGGLSDCNGTIINCVIWQNTAAEGAQIYASSTPSYSCIQDWTGGGIGNINFDPCFVDAAGGDYHLSLLSPCIDAGDPSYSPSPGETDIDGEPRVFNSHIEIGADEINNEEPLIGVTPGKIEFVSQESGPNPEPQIISIWNAGVDVINWQIIEDCTWLEAWPTNGVSTGQTNEVTLTVDTSTLSIGSYTCTLEVHDLIAINSPQIVSVTLHIFSEIVYVPSRISTIQGAIDHVLDEGNVIVADGIYTGEGNRDIDFRGKAITVRSENGPDTCIIDCNGTEADPHRGFHFHKGEDANSILNGFTITNGYASGNYAGGGGGAVICEHSSPLINNCIIPNNLAEHSGGGIACWEQSRATITNCTFIHNIAKYGGGMLTKDSNTTILNCIFTNNYAEGSQYGQSSGGGMYASGGSPILTGCTFNGNAAYHTGGGMRIQGSSPKLTDCTFSNNSAKDYGAGIANYFSQPSITSCIFAGNALTASKYGGGGGILNYESNPTLKNCAFKENSAPDCGGGISNWASNLEIISCTFNANSAGEWGGGMYSRDHSSLMLTNCVFRENVATERGGGINNSSSDSNLINCLFTGNSATYGGALYNSYSDHTITNVTFIGNSSDFGGAIYNTYKSSTALTNSILWDNIATISGNEIYLALFISRWDFPSEATVSYSDVKGGPAIVYVEPLCTLNWGSGNIDTDPCFVQPGYWDANGTPDDANDDYWIEGDYHLLPGSPCIDAGDPNYIAEPNETDLDGKPRVMGGRIDMGAYEYRPPISAEMDVEPETLNLASKGRWITAFIQLPEDYNVADIDPNSIFLENEIKPARFWLTEDNQTAIAKFNREEVQDILDIGQLELTITGQLTDGNLFVGTDVITVIDKSGGKSPK